MREVEEEMVEFYFGSVSEANMARVTVHKALADLKWATWSMLQNEISTLDFDYFNMVRGNSCARVP
jgi:hypothetical protein